VSGTSASSAARRPRQPSVAPRGSQS
jgi:hypothetical protein